MSKGIKFETLSDPPSVPNEVILLAAARVLVKEFETKNLATEELEGVTEYLTEIHQSTTIPLSCLATLLIGSIADAFAAKQAGRAMN